MLWFKTGATLDTIRIPPFVMIGRILQKVECQQIRSLVLIAPYWPTQCWYPQLLRMIVDIPVYLPQTMNLISCPSGETHPLLTNQTLQLVAWKVSGSHICIKAFQKRLLKSSASWRKGTEKSYSFAWSKRQCWCDRRDRDPLRPSIVDVVDFLTEGYQEGLQYSTLNSYRSALSATLAPIEGCQVGQHPIIVKLLQGIFNSRPPRPRYNDIWIGGVVLEFIEKHLPNNSSLCLKDLSRKLVSLLVLVTAARSSDLHLIDTRYVTHHLDSVTVTFVGLTKTRRRGAPPQNHIYFQVQGQP